MNNLKTIIFISLCMSIFFLYNEYSYQKDENIRQTENVRQNAFLDSTKYAQFKFSESEIKRHLEFQNKKLLNKLKTDNVKTERIKDIITTKVIYKDTTFKQTDVNAIIQAVKQSIDIIVPYKDSTECLVIKGFIQYKNDTLRNVITKRVFKNTSNSVVYWQRKKWSILGIKTRFLGKKEFIAKNYNDCGTIETIKIEKTP